MLSVSYFCLYSYYQTHQKMNAIRYATRLLLFICVIAQPIIAHAQAVSAMPATTEEIATPSIIINVGPKGSYQPSLKSVVKQELVYDTVDNIPQAKGGNGAITAFFRSNIAKIKNNKGESPLAGISNKDLAGTILLQVTIDKNGQLINPKIVSSPNPKLSDVTLQLLSLLGKDPLNKWSPATRGGKAVNAHYNIAVKLM
jgi:Gram-negative bacterial TonB protein C-terminal